MNLQHPEEWRRAFLDLEEDRLFSQRDAISAPTAECDCEDVQIRKRTIRGGGIQYVEQCQVCGRAASNPIKRTEAIQQAGGEPEPFDDTLQPRWYSNTSTRRMTASGRRDALEAEYRAAWDALYASYLGSTAWQRKRILVFERSGRGCEGCRKRKAEEVHHLSYDHVGDELLFELVAVCGKCHRKIHAKREDMP